MAYFHMLSDLGMNYTLNRALNDATATARIEENESSGVAD
jgi:tyrosyl-tRNA synthetase